MREEEGVACHQKAGAHQRRAPSFACTMKGSIDCIVRSTAPPSACTASAAARAMSRVRAGLARSWLTARARVGAVLHHQGAARLVDGGVDLRGAVHVRPVQDRGAELRRLDRVVAADGNEGAAHEHDVREAIEQAHLADRIGHIDVGRPVGMHSLRAASGAKPARSAMAATSSRCGWRGAMMVSRCGWCWVSARCTATMAVSSPGWVLAASQTGRPARSPERCATTRGSAGGGAESNFRVAGHQTRGAPSPRSPRPRGLGKAQGEALQQGADDARQLLPAPERAVRHAPVHEHKRDVTLIQRHDRVGPDLRFRHEARSGCQWSRKRRT